MHGSIPAPPTPLWTLLPYTGQKACVDHLGHPVVVLNLRDVARDDTGSLDELKDWTWWGLELVRRALKEYWVDGRRGTGAEGAVLIIDAANAGYRNLVSGPVGIMSGNRTSFRTLVSSLTRGSQTWARAPVACRHERLHKLHQALAKLSRDGMQRHARCSLRHCSGPCVYLASNIPGHDFTGYTKMFQHALSFLPFVLSLFVADTVKRRSSCSRRCSTSPATATPARLKASTSSTQGGPTGPCGTTS